MLIFFVYHFLNTLHGNCRSPDVCRKSGDAIDLCCFTLAGRDHPTLRLLNPQFRSLRRKPKGGDRMPFKAIADKLNADGVPTRTGRPWHGEVVRRLLGGER